MKNLSLILGSALLVSACSIERQYETYDDLLERAQKGDIDALLLTRDNHPHGWGQSQCFRCHVLNNIHLKNKTGDAVFDGHLEFARSIGEDVTQCSMCHDDNGVTP